MTACGKCGHLALVAALTLCATFSSTIPEAEAAGDERFIMLASTTSTENSGLLQYLLPLFEAESGIAVRTLVRGTGQALRLAEQGDADVLMVHHPASEARFVAQGHGVKRYPVMYNDFVLIGPAEDPAGVAMHEKIETALQAIATSGAIFTSRGDDSGTHKKELELWSAAGVDPAAASGSWYRELGAGMGATLNSAGAMGAYVLSDRATWLSFKNKAGLAIVSQGDERLFNPYGVILVNPERHAHIKADDGQAFIDWLTSAPGQAAIAAYRLDGAQLFFPNAE